MAGGNDSGDKTEEPTPKRLEEARKKGDVPKSKDVSSTVGLLLWVLVLSVGVPYAGGLLADLTHHSLQAVSAPISDWGIHLRSLTRQALHAFLAITALALAPSVTVGVLTEFLQAGPVFTTEKLKFNPEHLNPVEGIKRMFKLEVVVELLKSVSKTAIVLWVGWTIARSVIQEFPHLLRSSPAVLGMTLWDTLYRLVLHVAAISVVIALLDALWQRHRYMKKMRMSLHDIKEENKNAEGDPVVKGQRKQLHKEWAQEGAKKAATSATALVVNPTHVAVAIAYDRSTCPVPMVTAIEEDEVALSLRQAAQEAGVPVVRNVELARALLHQGEVGHVVPTVLFDLIAEVILWAKQARAEVDRCRSDRWSTPQATRFRPPGKDLTRYRPDDPDTDDEHPADVDPPSSSDPHVPR